MKPWLRNAGETLLEALFPSYCCLCQRQCPGALPLCLDCKAALPRNRYACRQCALPLPQPVTTSGEATAQPGEASPLCGSCLHSPPPFDRVIAPWIYDAHFAYLIGRWKYARQQSLTALLAHLWLAPWAAKPMPDLLVPVPLHWRKLWRRGFNQATLLASELQHREPAMSSCQIVTRGVRRHRATAAQSKIGAAQRRRNLRAAFTVERPCANLRVAIVDDVLTTGATAAALATALREAGAAGVEVGAWRGHQPPCIPLPLWPITAADPLNRRSCVIYPAIPRFAILTINPGLRAILCRVILSLLVLTVAAPASSATLRIAVAANFKPTLERISQAFEQRSGHRVLLSGAATGALHNQISAGAPFDLFFAADQDSITRLEAAGRTGPARGFCYAVGRLVLAGGNGRLDQLANPELGVAIANPAIAPYGRAAAEVLVRPEFAAGGGRKLVRGASVAQAYQFWHSGGVALALLPRSLAPGTVIPASWHKPIEQFAVRLPQADTSPVADAYLEWLNSATVRSLIVDAGYQLCS